MNTDSRPLSLYRSPSISFQYFQNFIMEMKDPTPEDVILNIKNYYISLISNVFDECKAKINNDPFPTHIYRQLKLMKDSGLADYKVGGSAALKLATADKTWENDDVDIMVCTEMVGGVYAEQLGLTTLIKSWTKGVDVMNTEREEKFHENIYQVLTYQHHDFDKNIQLVFFEKLENSSFTNFLDKILDYPAHVLYEVDFDSDDRKIYNFLLPVKMWRNILQKRIPKNLHCLKSAERIQKYTERGFVFFS